MNGWQIVCDHGNMLSFALIYVTKSLLKFLSVVTAYSNSGSKK